MVLFMVMNMVIYMVMIKILVMTMNIDIFRIVYLTVSHKLSLCH